MGCCGICSTRFLGAGLCVLWCLVVAWLVLWFRVFGVFWFFDFGWGRSCDCCLLVSLVLDSRPGFVISVLF